MPFGLWRQRRDYWIRSCAGREPLGDSCGARIRVLQRERVHRGFQADVWVHAANHVELGAHAWGLRSYGIWSLMSCSQRFVSASPRRTGVPFFTFESVPPAKHREPLMPNDVTALYDEIWRRPARALILAGQRDLSDRSLRVQVIAPACRRSCSPILKGKINFKVPTEAPTSGEAPIVVTVRGVSSQPVMVPFGKRKMMLSLAARPMSTCRLDRCGFASRLRHFVSIFPGSAKLWWQRFEVRFKRHHAEAVREPAERWPDGV